MDGRWRAMSAASQHATRTTTPPSFSGRKYEAGERVTMKRRQTVREDSGARRKEPRRIEHGGRARQEPPQVVKHPGDALAGIEQLRLGAGAEDDLIARGHQDLRGGGDR